MYVSMKKQKSYMRAGFSGLSRTRVKKYFC